MAKNHDLNMEILRFFADHDTNLSYDTVTDLVTHLNGFDYSDDQILEAVQQMDVNHLGYLQVELMLDPQDNGTLNLRNSTAWLSATGRKQL